MIKKYLLGLLVLGLLVPAMKFAVLGMVLPLPARADGSCYGNFDGYPESYASFYGPHLFPGGTMNFNVSFYGGSGSPPMGWMPQFSDQTQATQYSDVSVTVLDPSIVSISGSSSFSDYQNTSVYGGMALTGLQAGTARIQVSGNSEYSFGEWTASCSDTEIFTVTVDPGAGQAMSVVYDPAGKVYMDTTNGWRNAQYGYIVCGMQGNGNDNYGNTKMTKLIFCPLTQQAKNAGANLGGVSFHLDSDQSRGMLNCDNYSSPNAAAGMYEGGSSNQMDKMNCAPFYGAALQRPYTMIIGNADGAWGKDYMCPTDSIVTGTQNAPGKNDSWDRFMCEKVLFGSSAFPKPTASLTATVWQSWAGNGRDTVWGYNNSQGPISAYSGAPFQLNWSSSNASSCTIDGGAVSTSGSNNTYTAGGGGWSHTYTLTCTSSTGSASSSVNVSVPNNPYNAAASCSTSGSSSTANFSWSLPAGYSQSYIRIYDQTDPAGVSSNGQQGYLLYIDGYGSTSWSGSATPGHTYSFWVHTFSANSAWSDATYPVSNPVTCPAATGTVIVNSNVSSTWKVSGPSGWTSTDTGTTKTYSGRDPGTYSVAPVSAPAGYTLQGVSVTRNLAKASIKTKLKNWLVKVAQAVSVNPPSSQTLAAGSTIIFNITWTPQYTLSVSKAGTGSGTITSSPAGINCGATCSASYISGTSVTLTATPSSGTSFGGWSGACSGTGTCTVSMTAAKAVTATFSASAPTISFSASPSSTSVGSAFTLSWSSSNATSISSFSYPAYCTPTVAFPTAGSSEVSGSRSVTCSQSGVATFSAGITGPGGSNGNGIGVPIGPKDPSSITASNSTCQQINLAWNAGTGASSYLIYRNTSNTPPGSSMATVSGLSYTDSTASVGTTYYYWVQSTNGGGLYGNLVPAATNSSGGISPSACAPNLSLLSDKDILSANGQSLIPGNTVPADGNACTGSTNALPAGTALKVGDTLIFSLNLCNSGNGNANSITLTDSMTNLSPVNGDGSQASNWNLQYDPGTGVLQSLPAGATFSYANNTITISGLAVPAKVGSNTSVRRIVYSAKLSLPSGFSGAIARFQNLMNISYISENFTEGTALLPFDAGSGVPSRTEQ